MFGRKTALFSLAVFAMAGTGWLFYMQTLFLEDIFPTAPTQIRQRAWWDEYINRHHVRFFGFEEGIGRFEAMRRFGQPLSAKYNGDYRDPWGGVTDICVYTYPGMELRFFDDRLSHIAITGPQWAFPLGFRVGDPESVVYDRIGQPAFRLRKGTELYYQFPYGFSGLGPLQVILSSGVVSEIHWSS